MTSETPPVIDFSALSAQLAHGTDVVSILVYGQAATKGSSRAIPYKGNDGKLHVRVMADNRKRLKGWESSVRTQAQLHAYTHQGRQLEGPLSVRIYFALDRPPSVSEKKRPLPHAKPDLDKLLRAAMDPLIGVVFKDDALICSVEAHKRYAQHAPFVLIEVRSMVAAAARDDQQQPGLLEPVLAPAPPVAVVRRKRAAHQITAEDL